MPDLVCVDTGLMFMLDTNCINARQADPALNQLEEWSDAECITIIMCATSQAEAFAGGHPTRFRKAMGYAYSETLAETPEERRQLVAIEQALFPTGAATSNQKNDVEIVFNAMKYTSGLITNDGGSKRQPGGILGAAAQLMRDHGFRAMTPAQAVDFVRQRIRHIGRTGG